jgi:pyrimidine-specific ribonucleoside hydrolase
MRRSIAAFRSPAASSVRLDSHGCRSLRAPSSAADAKSETEASRGLATALRASPLTILALGPATNVATTLAKHPELASRVTRIIAVAGRRPGQRFTTGTSNARGHRDFNFELDPGSFQVLLDSNTEVVLTPFEISSKIWLNASDLDRLAASPSATARRPRVSGAGVARLVDAALRRRRLQPVRHTGRRLRDFFERL